MKILMAVDQPDFARAMRKFVIEHKWPTDTKLVVMSVVKPLKVNNALAVLPGPVLDELEEKQYESAKNLVAETAQSIRQSLTDNTIEEVVKKGFPKEEILDFAREQSVDLLVLGSHGRTELGRLFLGSVSTAVMAHAPCSLVIVHLDEQTDLDEGSSRDVA